MSIKRIKLSRIFMLIAWALLIIGVVLLVRTWFFAYDSVKADGTVIRNDSIDNEAAFVPVVAFVDENGEEYQFISDIASSPAAFNVGDRVTVYYEKGKPTVARINSFFQMYLTEFILIGLGFSFYILSMVFKKVI